MDWEIDAAMGQIETRRPVVDFADVYVESVRRFLTWRLEGAAQRAVREIKRNYFGPLKVQIVAGSDATGPPLKRAAFLLGPESQLRGLRREQDMRRYLATSGKRFPTTASWRFPFA